MDNNIKSIINTILEAHQQGEKYIYVDKHPVDTRNKQYPVWHQWLKRDKLVCFGCGRSPHYFKLTECKGGGSAHESGETKHHLKLVSVNTKGKETPFTLDHWIPKSFLNKLSQLAEYIIKDNLVPMCSNCNSIKRDNLPKNFKWGITKYKPELSIKSK